MTKKNKTLLKGKTQLETDMAFMVDTETETVTTMMDEIHHGDEDYDYKKFLDKIEHLGFHIYKLGVLRSALEFIERRTKEEKK